MNEFFIDKIKEISRQLPEKLFDPLATLKKLMHNRTCIFQPEIIDQIISNLKNSKSSGVDHIDTYIIKLAKNELLTAITHIVNLSITQCIFPEQFKLAKVIPLHKKDDWLNPKNFRPVAILPILSKIIEKAVFIQMIEYMNENELLHPNHHGFCAGHNTTTALIQMYDSWIEALEKREYSGVCLLDMSAAFDMVTHPLLTET